MLSQFGSEGDESSENIIRLNPPNSAFDSKLIMRHPHLSQFKRGRRIG